MATKRLKLTHPAKIIREEFMQPVGITAHVLAKALHVPLSKVSDIVLEKRAISPEMAVLLSAYFSTVRHSSSREAHSGAGFGSGVMPPRSTSSASSPSVLRRKIFPSFA